jgi:hypothetical protein
MPLQATSGAASYDAFGGGAAAVPQYIEDVFSTYLYTGNGTAGTISNNIDLTGKGGLVWIKNRAATGHRLVDTVRGIYNQIETNSTAAQSLNLTGLFSFQNNGFLVSSDNAYNQSGSNYASWTFREQAKFFDVVTWTGNGANRTIAHNLGSVPGCIIVKRTDTTADWQVYHRSLANTQYMVLNSDAAVATGATRWNSTTPTATEFSLGTDTTVNASGGTYIAYIFAHNAGGFGLTSTDNVITCGSYTGNGSAENNINLGYEPQWLLVAQATNGTDPNGQFIYGPWSMFDTMRSFPTSNKDAFALFPYQSNAEAGSGAYGVNTPHPTSTGFMLPVSTGQTLGGTSANSGLWFNRIGATYIYIAIRRGPMKVPTTGTSVFGLNARTGTGVNATVTGSAGVSDAALIKNRGSAVGDLFASRLTGTGYMETSSTAAEVAAGTTILQANPWDVMDGVKVGTTSTITNASANTYINYLFDRAPGFFDVVCYTGTGVNRTVAHNLAAVPELMIVKQRSASGGWVVYSAASGAVKYQYLNTTVNAVTLNTVWNSTAPTASVFTVGTDTEVNTSAATYVAYLFTTCPGVSKVGSFTGTGATQVIDCGFTGGARFVLIKSTSTTGNWYVWDSARGIVAGNDPYLELNTSNAEVTNTDWVDTAATGFELSNAGGNLANSNGVSYIFLAIA